MSLKKDAKDVALKVVGGLIVAVIVALANYFYKNPQTKFSWLFNNPFNLISKFYLSYSIPMRLNVFLWIMTFFIYFILEKYDNKYDIEKKREIKEENFKSGTFTVYSFFVTIGLINIDKFSFPHNMYSNIAFDTIGIILTISGFLIVVLGRVEIDGLWGPHLCKYSDPQFQRLIKTGIYSKMRHPIYLGQTTLAFSTFITSNSFILLFFPLIVIAVNSFRAYNEEKYLIQEFGTEYMDYKKEVKKWWWY